MQLLKAKRRLSNLMRAATRGFVGRWDLPDLSRLSTEDTQEAIEFEPPVAMVLLEETLAAYGVHATISDYVIGSAVTTYKVDFAPGAKYKTLTRNQEDIARSLGVDSIRITPEGPGIEIQNSQRLTVAFGDVLRKYPDNGAIIPMILGEATNGELIYEDLTNMPHLLVAGSTGSGKSVFLNSLICTVLATRMPDQVKLLLIDPKQVEFQDYHDVPHLLEPIAHNSSESIRLLDNAIEIMEERFGELSRVRARKLSEYREKTGKELPYIVFIVDEYADLMQMGSAKERKAVEGKIARIAQKARAVGIHLVLATQKPVVQVVTTVLKANLNARVAFSVATGTDSRVILDETGAEDLTGKGDMLYRDPRGGDLQRLQAPWIPSSDIDIIIGEA